MKKTALLLALLMGPASAPMRLDADAHDNDARGNWEFLGGREKSPSIQAKRAGPSSANQTTPTQATFFDGTFNNTDWELIPLTNEPTAGTTTAFQQAISGNPGFFRQVDITLNAAVGGQIPYVLGFHRKIGATFDPRTTGAITSIDYSEDAIFLGLGSGDGQATGPAVRQGGKIFFAASLVTHLPRNWTTLSLSAQHASDFFEAGIPGVFINYNSHPDFSSSGAPIEFGFFRANSGGPSSTLYRSSFGIDNWRVTVNYSLAPACNFSISPIGQAFPAAGGAGSVQMAAATGCNWTAASNANWITITSGSSGSGVGTINYQVAQNIGTARAGTVAITGGELTVTQADGQSSCTYSISPGSATFPGAGGYGRIQVTAFPGCAWAVSGIPPWISILKRGEFGGSSADTAASGIGNGIAQTIRYAVITNTGSSRTATITIAGQPFTINQDGATPGCSYTVLPTSVSVRADFLAVDETVTVGTRSDCTWMAVSQSAWIVVDAEGSDLEGGDLPEKPPAGNGGVSLRIGVNRGPGRSGTINVAGQTVTVSEDGVCVPSSYSLEPVSQVMSSDHGQVKVRAPNDCAWEATRSGNWITIDDGNASGRGNSTINFHVLRPADVPRHGSISVGGANAYITEEPAALSPHPLCVALWAIFEGGGDSAKILDTLRNFRDQVLAATPRGRQYTELYYQFSGEAIKQLMFSPTLLLNTRKLLEHHQAMIESIAGGRQATLGKADLEEIDALLNSFSSGASPEFAAALRQLRRDLRDPRVHAEFGVKVP